MMVSFNREPRLLKSQRIADKILKEVLHLISSIILIFICMGGCYFMLLIMARRPPEVDSQVDAPILFGSNNREIRKRDKFIIIGPLNFIQNVMQTRSTESTVRWWNMRTCKGSWTLVWLLMKTQQALLGNLASTDIFYRRPNASNDWFLSRFLYVHELFNW